MSTPDPKTTDRKRSRLVLEGVPPPRPWKRRIALTLAWLGLTGLTAALVGVLGVYYVFSRDLPAIPKVEEYWPPIVTEVYTDDAVLAGEFYSERRKVVPYERIPKRMVPGLHRQRGLELLRPPRRGRAGHGARGDQDGPQEAGAGRPRGGRLHAHAADGEGRAHQRRGLQERPRPRRPSARSAS